MVDPFKELNSKWKEEFDDLMQDYKEVCKENENLKSKLKSSNDLNMGLAVTIDDLLYEKDQKPAFSDNDFVKWQEYRQDMERKIAAMTYNYHHAREEALYWQREAMKNQGRD